MRLDEPPLGRRYEVNGRGLLLHRSGGGAPSVVFLPGAGLAGLDFLNVQAAAAAFTTSVLYDRAGTGWSAPAPLPRTAAEVAAELRALLRAAAVPGPYVLAGHSLGACYARRYAQLFPGEVAGLLLLDPGHEDLFSYLPPAAAELNEQMKAHAAQLPELTSEQREAARGQYATLYADWPEGVRQALIGHHLATWRIAVAESANLEEEVYPELRAGGPLPDVPLIVLTAMGGSAHWAQFASGDLVDQTLAGLRSLHEAIAGSVTRGEHRALPAASHQYLHIEQPQAVAAALRDLLAWARPA